MTKIKSTFIAVALTFGLAATAAANPPAAGDYCNAIAEYAEAVATDRDNGTPESVAIAIASRGNPGIRADLIFITQLVHTEPYGTPDQEAVIAFSACWDAYGE